MRLEYFKGDSLPEVLPIFYFDKRLKWIAKAKLTLPFKPIKVIRIEFRRLAKSGYNIWLEDGSSVFGIELYDLLVEA